MRAKKKRLASVDPDVQIIPAYEVQRLLALEGEVLPFEHSTTEALKY